MKAGGHSAVLVLADALQTKFSLSNKIEKSWEYMPMMSMYVLLT